MILIAGYISFQTIVFGVLFWGRTELARFLREHSAIHDHAALAKYKDVARASMYGALVFLGCGIVLIVWSMYLAREYGLTGVAIAVACSVPSVFLGVSARRLEGRARSLECGDPELRPEYRRVSDVWVKRALPDF